MAAYSFSTFPDDYAQFPAREHLYYRPADTVTTGLDATSKTNSSDIRLLDDTSSEFDRVFPPNNPWDKPWCATVYAVSAVVYST